MKTWTLIFPPHGDYLSKPEDVGAGWGEDCFELRKAALMTMREAYAATASFGDGTPVRLSARIAKRLPGNRPPLSRRQRLKSGRRRYRKFEAMRRMDGMARQVVGMMIARSPVLGAVLGRCAMAGPSIGREVVVRPNPEWEATTHEIIGGRIQRRHILVVDEMEPGLTEKQFTDLESVIVGKKTTCGPRGAVASSNHE